MTDQARLWRDVPVSGGTVIMRREIDAAGSPLSAPGWRWEYFHAWRRQEDETDHDFESRVVMEASFLALAGSRALAPVTPWGPQGEPDRPLSV